MQQKGSKVVPILILVNIVIVVLLFTVLIVLGVLNLKIEEVQPNEVTTDIASVSKFIGNIEENFVSKNTENPKSDTAKDSNVTPKVLKKLLKHKNGSQLKYDEVTGELTEGDNPCKRECIEGEEPMICHYGFELEWYQTMSRACFNCPFNLTDCFRPDCIPADGISRALNVINRKMPGPAIEVCQHDRVIVDVTNNLMAASTTVHWHGLHQRGTPFMDGVPFVTQCPIPPETTFRYQFNASNSGTHFWHSHSGMQRADGVAGIFIVRKPKSQEYHERLYDYDRSEHVMLVTDWTHDLAVGTYTDKIHAKGLRHRSMPPTLLINGMGRFKIFNNDSVTPLYMRASRFNVEKGHKYRFRLINGEFLNCPVEISVDGHNITVIASDGHDLQPITTTSLVTYAGERYDFILEANNKIDNYWIKIRGSGLDCNPVSIQAKQVGVLHYEGALDAEPPGNPSWDEAHNEGLQLNALNKGEEDNETISVADMRSIEDDDESSQEVADYQFYITYDFHAKNSPFHRPPYGYNQVPKPRLNIPQLNHISMKLPSSPLLTARPSADQFCNASSIDKSCENDFCKCSHVLSVKLNSVVEIVIVDEGVYFEGNHPFHLHGHNFRVVGLRRLGKKTSVAEVKAYDKAGLLKRNLKNAPIKDTVTVPDGGYTVIRFKADNPGYWLFHCHIEFHVEIGMALVFKVGDHNEMTPVPPNFPTCGNYVPDNMLELATTEDTRERDAKNYILSDSHSWPAIIINNKSPSSSTKTTTSVVAVLLGIWLSVQSNL